jgi:hypothetical protein
MFAQLMSDARSAEYELVESGDEDRLFYKLPWWKKLDRDGLRAWRPTWSSRSCCSRRVHGSRRRTATTTVDDGLRVRDRGDRGQRDQRQRACTAADPVAPAKAAGSGRATGSSRSTARPVTHWEELQTPSAATARQRHDRRRARRRARLTLHPHDGLAAARPGRPAADHQGRLPRRPPTQQRERQGIGFAVTTMADGTWETLKTIGALPVKVYHVGRAAVGLEERDPTGPMSVVGAGRVAGEVASEHRSPTPTGSSPWSCCWPASTCSSA